uniref:DNA polymerase III subunit delta' n=1 Tax=Altererythrobacter segetis TaxID=1104773 RepID=UPI00140AE236|nr:DNA polymerase III subunit delta' [Altererythrobacter segetis]
MSFAGHEEPWREWRAALGGERMHHAWILTGRRGVGKAAFALQAARELVGGPAMDDHPDVIVLTHPPKDDKEADKRAEGKPYETKRNIPVDEIRAMQRRLTTRPTLGERRVVIVDPADDLEPSASNALLKSLEEPPHGTFFVLVAHRIGRLLPTIRSRCRVLRFPPVPDEEIDAILRREAPEADQATRAAAMAASAGSPGVALEFVGLGLGELHKLMQQLVRSGDPDFARRGKLAEAIGARPDRQRQLAAIDLARSVVTEEMRTVANRDIPALADAHAELSRLAAQAPTYNYDPGLLVMEIGSLLAALAAPSERVHG